MSIAFNAISANQYLTLFNQNPYWKISVNIRDYGPRLTNEDFQQDYEIHLCLRLLKAFLCKEMLCLSTSLLEQIISQDTKVTSYEAFPTFGEMLNRITDITSGENFEFQVSYNELPSELYESIENLPVGQGCLYRAWIPFGNFVEDGKTAFEETYGIYKESKNSFFLIDTTTNLSVELFTSSEELLLSLLLKMNLSSQQPPAKMTHYPIRKID